MKLGIVSDSHGNLRMLHQAAEQLWSGQGVDVIVHLGDDYADGETLRDAGMDVRIVPGLSCPEYFVTSIPSVWTESFDDVWVACAHTPDLVGVYADSAPIVMHGHTHVARAEQRGDCLWLNPGHLKAAYDRGQRASFATLEIAPHFLYATVFEFDGSVRQQTHVPRAALRKVGTAH